MRTDLLQVDRLLSQAHDACEESSTTDVLLDHLIDDLLLDTMTALRADDLHQGITAKAYNDLFLPLALLDSIVTINAGQVLHATLAAAHMLLDQLHTGLDVVGWTESLPERPGISEGRAVANAAQPDADADEDTPVEIAWFRAAEAIAILDLVDKSDAVCGARHLLDLACEILTEQAPAGNDRAKLEQASLLMCYAIDIMRADAAATEDRALDGALTLARISKDHLDSQWDTVPRSTVGHE